MTIDEIERAIEHLSEKELAEFRAWFKRFVAIAFDLALDRDIQVGKLDAFVEETLSAYRAGQARDL